jgi:hypothetical protein
MIPTMTTILQRFTGEWAIRRPPEAMLTGCRAIASTAWRDRVLPPVTTIHLCLWPRRHGHTACRHRPPLSGVRFTAAASGQARAHLPWRVFALLRARCGRAGQRSAWDDGRWQGHRPVLGDGSGGSMPATPTLQDACGQPTEPRPGGGVPVARRLGRCPAGTGVRLTRVVAPLLTHDRARVPAVHPR